MSDNELHNLHGDPRVSLTGNPVSGGGTGPINENDEKATVLLKNAILNWALRGMNKTKICGLLRISTQTLANWEKRDPEFSQQLAKSFNEKGMEVIDVIWELAIKDKDFRAAQWLAEKVVGLEKAPTHETDVKIIVQLPSPPGMRKLNEDTTRIIDVTPIRELSDKNQDEE